MNNIYFIYRHIRIDKNVPFYIGIGTKQSKGKEKSLYARAYATKNRNSWWNKITAKTKYEVEIMLESDDIFYIKNKEIEFINIYKATLCNMTEGGDNTSPACKKTVYQYSLDGEYIKSYVSAVEAARTLDIGTSALNRSLTGKRKSNNFAGFQWYYEYKGNKINSTLNGKVTTKKKVRLYNETENHIFNSREECAAFIKRSPGRVTDLLKTGIFNNYKIESYEN